MTEREIFRLYLFYNSLMFSIKAGKRFPLSKLEQAMKKASEENQIARGLTNLVPIISTFSQKHPEWKKF